jgi:DNA-binding PadR family transcriptional regulator
VGYLTSSIEVVAGKPRRYYRATLAGAAALEASKDKLHELVSEVLDDRPGESTRRPARLRVKRPQAKQ